MEVFVGIMLLLAIIAIIFIQRIISVNRELSEKRAKEMIANMKNSKPHTIPEPNKQDFGRCANAVGHFGFDVSNPIRISSIYDSCFGEYLYGMYIDGEGISGYIVVSKCWCSLFGEKPVYRVGVRKSDKKSFFTLYFIEDGITKPQYYPNGILDGNDLYFQKVIKNGGHVFFKDSYFQNGMLLKKENSQKAIPILKEKVYDFPLLKKKDGEDASQFASRVQDQRTRKMLSDDYWKFVTLHKKLAPGLSEIAKETNEEFAQKWEKITGIKRNEGESAWKYMMRVKPYKDKILALQRKQQELEQKLKAAKSKSDYEADEILKNYNGEK